MGWLAVLLIVLGVLAMLIGCGLTLRMRSRDYGAWREARGPEGSPEGFERENHQPRRGRGMRKAPRGGRLREVAPVGGVDVNQTKAAPHRSAKAPPDRSEGPFQYHAEKD